MRRSERTLLFVLVAALLAVLTVSFLDGDEEERAAAPPGLDASQLANAAAGTGRAVYWVGPRPGARYELTETDAGWVYVRYLRDDAEAGEREQPYLTVATYPAKDAVGELRLAAREAPGAKLRRSAEGQVLLIDPSLPESAYVAYPRGTVQVEINSPARGQAWRLASAGAVRRLAGAQPAG